MRNSFTATAFFLITNCFFSKSAISQRSDDQLKVNCNCDTYHIKKTEENNITLISCASAVKYINNYRRKYRKSDKLRIIHPQFVNFSKQSLLEIYDFFDKDTKKEYRGIDFYFSLLSKINPKDIQLFLTPEKVDHSSDFKKFDLVSNSGTSYSNTYLDPIDAYQYKENYEDLFRSKKKHTKSIFLDTANFRFMGLFFKDPLYVNYLGVKVYFASYNKYLKEGGDRIKNGQVRRKEITLVIIPVDAKGEPDFCAFDKFWEKYPHKLGDESGLNHGTLCPTQCPQGGN